MIEMMIAWQAIALVIMVTVIVENLKRYKAFEKKMQYYADTIDNINKRDLPMLYKQFMCTDEWIQKCSGREDVGSAVKGSWALIKDKRLKGREPVGFVPDDRPFKQGGTAQ